MTRGSWIEQQSGSESIGWPHERGAEMSRTMRHAIAVAFAVAAALFLFWFTYHLLWRSWVLATVFTVWFAVRVTRDSQVWDE